MSADLLCPLPHRADLRNRHGPAAAATSPPSELPSQSLSRPSPLVPPPQADATGSNSGQPSLTQFMEDPVNSATDGAERIPGCTSSFLSAA
ncbi:unnamed protein product [Urochloa humidicola]